MLEWKDVSFEYILLTDISLKSVLNLIDVGVPHIEKDTTLCPLKISSHWYGFQNNWLA